MGLHTIAHENVTHLWLYVHLSWIQVLSYRHSMIVLSVLCFHSLLQHFVLVLHKLFRTLVADAQGMFLAVFLVLVLLFLAEMVHIVEPTIFTALHLFHEDVFCIIRSFSHFFPKFDVSRYFLATADACLPAAFFCSFHSSSVYSSSGT